MKPGDAQAVLLCAGFGKRLMPLTETVPKPLIKVGEKTLLDWHLDALAESGVRSAVLVVGHLEDIIRKHVATREGRAPEIQFARQERMIGTGEGLRSAAPLIRTDWFYVGYADVFMPPGEHIWSRLGESRLSRMAGARVRNGGLYGRLIVQDIRGKLRLTSIVEKDGQPTPGIVNAGAYFLPRDFLPELDRLSRSSRGELELTDAIAAFVQRGNEVEVIIANDWVDVGDAEGIRRANQLLR